MVVAGTAEQLWIVQFIVGAVVGLFAWTLIVRPEIDGVTRWTLLAAASLTVAYAVVTLLTSVLTDPVLGSFQDRGGWSSVLLRAAVVLWAAAILLRLLSFATSWLRSVEALALAGGIGLLAIWAGIVDAPEGLSDDGLWADLRALLLIAAALLVAEALAGVVGLIAGHGEEVGSWTADRGGLPERGAGFIAGVGLNTALLAAIALGAAVVIGLGESGSQHHGRVTLAGEPIAPEQPARPPSEQLPAGRAFPIQLVKTYMPVLAFRTDQPWLPQRVDRYVRKAWLQGPHGKPTRGNTLKSLPRSCPGLAPAPCYRLSIHCPAASGGCSHAHEVGPGPFDQPDRSGAVYVRVVRKSQTPRLFPAGVGTFGGEEPSTLIQYWYFYRYDEWTTPVLTGQLVQRHEGNWEAVTVGLSQDAPLFVAYSQHCRGEWVGWDGIEVADTARPRTRPLVAVARGSQANYAEADQERSPDWASCGGKVPSGSATLLSYASNIRDRTAYGHTWEPPPDGVIHADQRKPPLSFPGFWGGNGITQLVNQRPHTLEKGGEPRTPSMQSLWRSPLRTVFCGNWHRPRHTARKCPKG